MIKEKFLKIKQILPIIFLIVLCSCDPDDNYLGKDEVELNADVEDVAGSFIVSGYIKSLDSSKETASSNYYALNLDVKDAANWRDIEITITTDSETISGVLGDFAFTDEAGICFLDIDLLMLDKSNIQENFSVAFSKNVTYRIIILDFGGSMMVGLSNGDGLGCGTYAVMEEVCIDINQTIESL